MLISQKQCFYNQNCMRKLPKSFLHCQLEQSIKRTQKIIELEHQLTIFSRDNREMQSKISRLERQNSLLKQNGDAVQPRQLSSQPQPQPQQLSSQPHRVPSQHIPKREIKLGEKKQSPKDINLKASKVSAKDAFLNASRYLDQYQKSRYLQSPSHLNNVHYSARFTPHSHHSTSINLHSTANQLHSAAKQQNTPEIQNRSKMHHTVQSQFYENNQNNEHNQNNENKAKYKEESPIINEKEVLHTQIDRVAQSRIDEDALINVQLNRRVPKNRKKYLNVISKQVKEKGEDIR